MSDAPDGVAIQRRTADVVVIGTGVAGLACALELAGKRVDLITKTTLSSGSSLWAQGGVAVAMGVGDSPELHAADTVAAGAGLVDPVIAELLAEEGVIAIRRLIELGAEFDRSARGELDFGREAAHSRRRILHAHGDSTGAELVRALAERVRTAPWIRLWEGAFATELVVAPVGDPADGSEPGVVGVLARHADGHLVLHEAAQVVLATGGLGQLFRFTTNPPESTGDGLVLAAAAGARLVDLEFVQFHPTALAVDLDPLPLLSEALRGEGATLVNDAGFRFMPAEHADAELAPRDVVARGIWKQLAAGRKVFLDGRQAIGEQFPAKFPTIFANCQRAGVDPRLELMPVVPAAHYFMGGVAVDEWGRASLPGLWACGEVSATGVHGANRLASNSLLEALVFGSRVAEAIGASARREPPAGAAAAAVAGRSAAAQSAGDPVAALADLRREIRALSWERLGLMRDAAGLQAAQRRFAEILRQLPATPSEVRNLAIAGSLVAAAALHREESRGAHFRTDFPQSAEAWRFRQFLDVEIREHAVAVRFSPALEAPSDDADYLVTAIA
ncbi:MAG: L-aspartate oxidase [Thermoanaerobaculia bacterium]|nr:L-aspartate oxidase [Thermoanaerobaculia bacterium]MBP9825352.1 L-aspartate oxidase [Thermoanaerobaculia bacterium]